MKRIIVFFMLLMSPAFADCVFGAKAMTQYSVIDPHTVILSPRFGRGILIKTNSVIPSSGASVVVLKDRFCDFSSGVLYINGEVIDAVTVKWVD
jgi:hypothetical protein